MLKSEGLKVSGGQDLGVKAARTWKPYIFESAMAREIGSGPGPGGQGQGYNRSACLG